MKISNERLGKWFGRKSNQTISHMKRTAPEKYKTVLLGGICRELGIEDPDELEMILKLYKVQNKDKKENAC